MELSAFLNYLRCEKRAAQNTLLAYERDVKSFFVFAKNRDIDGLKDVTNTEIVSYILQLKKEGKSAATINRKLASLRGYYQYLIREGEVTVNPTGDIKSPKVERKELEYLSLEEVDRLLRAPDDSILGKRDRAILELLYATGIRVNEIIHANVEDVNLRIGFFTCTGDNGKARIIPMGRPARAAVEDYIYTARKALVREKSQETCLFVNYCGNQMTRQGLWKMLRGYGKKADIERSIAPNILRNSFAVHMIQNGADIKSLQELLGHEDLAATQIYLSLTKNRIKDVYDRSHPRA